MTTMQKQMAFLKFIRRVYGDITVREAGKIYNLLNGLKKEVVL